MRRCLAIFCAAAIMLAGCGGGSSGVSAATYVGSICSAIVPFEQKVQARSSALNLSSVKSIAEGKATLQQFMSEVAADTSTAVTRLRAAGTPNVANGKTIAAGVVSAFSQLQSALNTASKSAAALPTSDPTAFKQAATAIGGQVRTAMVGVGSTLSALKSPALEKAALTSPACKSLASGA